MTHYEQCCARECQWCGAGCDSNLKFNGRHYAMLDNFTAIGGGSACTAPTLSEFAERCAEALLPFAEIAKASTGMLTPSSFAHKAEWYFAARRALGLEKE